MLLTNQNVEIVACILLSPVTLTVNSSSFCVLLQARHLGAGPFFFSLESRLLGFYNEGHLKEVPVLFRCEILFIEPRKYYLTPS